MGYKHTVQLMKDKIESTPSKLSLFVPKSPQIIGLISLIAVISLWLTASILTHDILKDYNKPVLMTFISVASMQIYFVFLKIKDPLYNYLQSKSTDNHVRTVH
jgi:hypothetical protein